MSLPYRTYEHFSGNCELCLPIVISGECNRVDPLSVGLAKWKTTLKQFDSFSVVDHLVEPE